MFFFYVVDIEDEDIEIFFVDVLCKVLCSVDLGFKIDFESLDE